MGRHRCAAAAEIPLGSEAALRLSDFTRIPHARPRLPPHKAVPAWIHPAPDLPRAMICTSPALQSSAGMCDQAERRLRLQEPQNG